MSAIKALPPRRVVTVQGEDLVITPFKFFELESVSEQFEKVISIARALGAEAGEQARPKIQAVIEQATAEGKSKEEILELIDQTAAAVANVPMERLFACASGPILSLCRVATRRDEAFFREIDVDEGLALAAAVFAVNKEQYGAKKFGAALQQVMAALAPVAS